MIRGMGIDIAEIDRIRHSIEQFGDVFIDRIFTPAEQNEAAGRKDFATYYAGRWAVKEAVSKALGCGIGLHAAWLEIETLNQPGGRPVTTLAGEAQKTLQHLQGTLLHVTLSHEANHAVAMAIIE